MTHRNEFIHTTLALVASIVVCSTAVAQTDRSATTGTTCGTACSETQMRSTASSSSRSLQSAPDDVSALAAAARSSDKDQLRTLLQKHGFSAAQLEGAEIIVNEIKSPRDAATGQASGKRQHGAVAPVDGGGTEPAPASKVTVTITVKLKPPTIIITIRW